MSSRACGKAVCGDCSSKKIDDNRVCDVCFYKANNVRAEERRKDQLRCKNDSTECYKEQILKERDDLNNLTKKKLELEKEVIVLVVGMYSIYMHGCLSLLLLDEDCCAKIE